MSVNKVILIGNVGNDPEMSFPESGAALAKFSLATTEHRSDGRELTDWHKIIMFGEKARFAENYIRKGTKLYVEGRIKYRDWEDKFNVRHKITEIIADNFEILGRSIASKEQ